MPIIKREEGEVSAVLLSESGHVIKVYEGLMFLWIKN
jgi:hypothetical protein